MRALILVVGCCWLCGCLAADGLKTTAEELEFFNQTTSDQLASLNRYTYEEQLRLVLVGNQVMHPPAVYLYEAYAANGLDVIPLVQKQLESADELTVRDMIGVLLAMKRIGSYDVSSDKSMMALLESKAANVDSQWAETINEMVAEIRSG